MSIQSDNSVFDEQTLARVLEAAYVLQEHNRASLELNLELQSDQLREQHAESVPTPSATAPEDKSSSEDDDYTRVLAQIVETQHLIQVRQLELESALALIADRLTQITAASGSDVGIVEEKTVRYQAGSGTSALPRGSELPMEKALCFTCLRTGQVMRCSDVNPEFLLDAEECHRRGIQSLIAVPIYHEGAVVGALELYFAKVQGFNEQDVHTCQLMAGLVTEAFARDAQLTSKKSLVAECASMLEALERLTPTLGALAGSPATKDEMPKEAAAAPVAEPSFVCRKCGHALVGEEQFCGKCGTPRIIDNEPPTLQSKVASLWQMKQSKNAPPPPSNFVVGAADPQGKANEQDFSESDLRTRNRDDEGDRLENELAKLLANDLPDFSVSHDPDEIELSAAHPRGKYAAGNAITPPEEPAGLQEIEDPLIPELVPETLATQTEDNEGSATEAALEKSGQDVTWTSAANARDFLERVAQSNSHNAFQHFWNMRRGDVYLAIAVILMAIVIRWGVWSTGVANPASHKNPEAELSMFDRLLVSTGLAEAPDKPEPKGNPDTKVWVDLHTALYYCPGTDLYGRTPKGKFTSQKDAQLDQYEPAYRKACD